MPGHDPEQPGPDPPPISDRGRLATPLALLVPVELGLGIAVLAAVPSGRPTALVPATGRIVYLLHAVLGLVLTVGALAYLLRTRNGDHLGRMSGVIGFTGVAVAAAGGALAVAHPLRLVGGGLMLLGALSAELGFVIPVLERISEDAPAGSEPPGPGAAGGTLAKGGPDEKASDR